MPALTLILLRHAEAARAGMASGPRGDHQRPLTPEGQRQVESTAMQLAALKCSPQVVVVSDAVRTQATWARVEQELAAASPRTWQVATEPKLYLSSLAKHFALLSAIDAAACSCVMVVGHNQTLSSLAAFLSGDDLILDTAEAVVLTLSASSWAEAIAREGNWTVAAYLVPK